MTQIKAEYVDHMGGDIDVVNAARVSFDKEVKLLGSRDDKLIHFLARNKHMSPFRHVTVKLRCHAPIFLARQLAKHQIGLAWNEVSRRYVDTPPDFFYPESWRARPKDGIKQGSGADIAGDTASDTYREALRACRRAYQSLLDQDVAPELARMVLPQSMMTSWIWTGSLEAWAHLVALRIDSHAQLEAQQFAAQVEDIMHDVAPSAWRALCEHS